MIVITMTSWVKRINNVKSVIESIMNNTLLPDRIYLNLSKTEFEGIELPSDLTEYINSNDRVILNWVEGENTKSMKKIFPILKYLDDDDIIIDADDDKLFPTDLIESRINDFESHNKQYPITSSGGRCGIGDALVISPMSLFQKKMFNEWERYVNDVVIHTYNDDRTYLYILYLNGYIAKSSSLYRNKELIAKYDLHLDNTSMKSIRLYPIGRNYDKFVKNVVFKLTHNTISNSFGFFKKKHDCVMVYANSAVDSKAMTCGEHLEIEYVIASLKKYCSSWYDRIFIVGSEPPDSIKNDVIHIPCDDPYTHCKDANIIHKLRYACENIPDLSDDFLMISDDQIVTKESSWSDMKPRIVRKYADWSEDKWNHNKTISHWHKCLYQTLKLFPDDKSAFWEPHIWSPMNKYKFIEMCNKYDYQNNINCISQSLYYNYTEQEIVRGFDHIHLDNIKKLNDFNVNNLLRHLSWTDVGFNEKKFRDILDIVVGFNNSSDTVISNVKPIKQKIVNNPKIAKLRDDIQSGRVIKVPMGSGFVWKRVK